jgi:DNA-binding phage protein
MGLMPKRRPGYRIYLAQEGETLIVLFGGGTKRGQQRDIDRAKALLLEYKARKKSLTSKASTGKEKRLNHGTHTTFKETVLKRVERDAAFAQALLDEAATLFLNGEPETARLILRDLINATIGFEQLATLTAKPSKSLHRRLSPAGNPSMDNLAAIFRAIRDRLNVSLEAHSVAV